MAKVGMIIGACVVLFVLPLVAALVINGPELKEAMRIDKSSGKLL